MLRKGFFLLLLFCVIGNLSANKPAAKLSVCLYHRKASLEAFDKETIRQWILPQKATDKGSGVFGHAWLWVEPLSLNETVFEIGHTGETNAQEETCLQKFYLASLKDQEEAIALFFQDRFDGKCEKSSGGHTPDEVWTVELSEKQYHQFKQWLAKGYYDFRRYNLGLHQCCHFVVEALEAIGIKLEEPDLIPLPKEIEIWQTRLVIWKDPKWNQLFLWTPYNLARSLEKQGGFDQTTLKYIAAHPKLYSLNPISRFWQKRQEAIKLITYSPEQVKRQIWLLGWKPVFAQPSL